MGNIGSKKEPESVSELLRKLHKAYEQSLMPLERETLFNTLGDPPYSEADIQAKPMLLMMGQYSTGKTTFIRALLEGKEYPGMHIAAEMSTDNFIAVMRGQTDDIIPGNALVNNLELPFHSLKFAFGESFLQRFRGSFVSSSQSEEDILNHVILVDTPGTLDGSGEDRNYNFSEVMGWFAKRAALIIIFFDVNKMGVSTEMKSVLDNIQGNEEKIKIVFNKADTVDERDLAGSLAGLRHNLAKSMPTPEVPEVYVTSLDTLADEYKTENKKFVEWFAKDKDKLVNDIQRMRDNTYFRKLNIMDKRARMVRNHAYVMMKLRHEQRKELFTTKIFLNIFTNLKSYALSDRNYIIAIALNFVVKMSQCLTWYRRRLRPKDVDKLINIIPDLYRAIQQEKNRSSQEFISARTLQDKLRHDAVLHNLPNLKEKQIEKRYKQMETALSKLATVSIKSDK